MSSNGKVGLGSWLGAGKKLYRGSDNTKNLLVKNNDFHQKVFSLHIFCRRNTIRSARAIYPTVKLYRCLQVLREERIRIGKISSLPASISQIRISLEKIL